jgi:hypothetical protein
MGYLLSLCQMSRIVECNVKSNTSVACAISDVRSIASYFSNATMRFQTFLIHVTNQPRVTVSSAPGARSSSEVFDPEHRYRCANSDAPFRSATRRDRMIFAKRNSRQLLWIDPLPFEITRHRYRPGGGQVPIGWKAIREWRENRNNLRVSGNYDLLTSRALRGSNDSAQLLLASLVELPTAFGEKN